jgi:hypothetical protein
LIFLPGIREAKVTQKRASAFPSGTFGCPLWLPKVGKPRFLFVLLLYLCRKRHAVPPSVTSPGAIVGQPIASVQNAHASNPFYHHYFSRRHFLHAHGVIFSIEMGKNAQVSAGQ